MHGVGWRATTIVTRANEWLEIPNAQLAKDLLFNYGNHAVADEVSIGLSYGEPPNRVREVILEVLRDVPDVLHHPEPEILAWEFGDYAIRYRVKYWLADYGRSEQIHARVVSGLWYAMRRHGIEIPFPIRTLVLRQEGRIEESEAFARSPPNCARSIFCASLTMTRCESWPARSACTSSAPARR